MMKKMMIKLENISNKKYKPITTWIRPQNIEAYLTTLSQYYGGNTKSLAHKGVTFHHVQFSIILEFK